MTSYPEIDASTLNAWLADSGEIALFDTREEGLYGEGHVLYAANLAYSRLERDIARLMPRRDTRIVLTGEPDTDRLAFSRLSQLGYRNVALLTGGVAGWEAAGNGLFKSVYTLSKAFAEVVEHHYHTPAIKADELARITRAGENVLVLDCRTTEEFERFHVPGAVSCPSAELVYRVADLVPSSETFVVVSCAGRTRGIIGAQTLINAQIPNRVAALEGGTQGWKLAGLETEAGRTAIYGPASDNSRATAQRRAAILADRFSVPRVSLETLQAWRSDRERTLYLFDVRTPEEFAAGHLPGAIGIAGGQLVQSLDKWAAVRGARIVLADPAGVRAVTTAHWLRQMGWDATALSYDETATTLEKGNAVPDESSLAIIPEIDSAMAKRWLNEKAVALSTDSSTDFRKAHPANALWVTRSRLATLPVSIGEAPVVLIFGRDSVASQLVAADLSTTTPAQKLFVVKGDATAWTQAGIEVSSSPANPPDADRIDFLFWLHDRHTGNADSSARYLAWEGDLPRQIGSPKAAGFRLPSQTH